MATTHELKTWIQYFQEVWNGNKKFELRKNDRGFKVGDFLKLKEYDNITQKYTGRHVTVKILYILEGVAFGLQEGFVILSID